MWTVWVEESILPIEQKIILHRDKMELMRGKKRLVDHRKASRKCFERVDACKCIRQHPASSQRILQLVSNIVCGRVQVVLGGVRDMNLVVHSSPHCFDSSLRTSSQGRVLPAATSSRPSCNFAYKSNRAVRAS